MTPLPRLVVLIVLSAVLVPACTGDDAGPTDPAVKPSGDGVVSRDTGDTEFIPGRFVYRFNDITAQATFEGSVATVTVGNGTGAELGPPSLSVVVADDASYEGLAPGAGAIADGEEVTVEITFPDAVSPQTIGLVVLSLGADNIGAMAPAPSSG